MLQTNNSRSSWGKSTMGRPKRSQRAKQNWLLGVVITLVAALASGAYMSVPGRYDYTDSIVEQQDDTQTDSTQAESSTETDSTDSTTSDDSSKTATDISDTQENRALYDGLSGEDDDSDNAIDYHSYNGRLSLSRVSEYAGRSYEVVSSNSTHQMGVPSFSLEEMARAKEGTFKEFHQLDKLGRVTWAFACVGTETLGTGKRGDISRIHPTGWRQARYDFVSGESLYNRCHLIAWSLCGENANRRNLMTGTRYLNEEGMLPFEEHILRYIKKTGNHVIYRVRPIYNEDELVARGVHMEAASVEDDGESLTFNVFCYNVQPNVVIDYATGASSERGDE